MTPASTYSLGAGHGRNRRCCLIVLGISAGWTLTAWGLLCGWRHTKKPFAGGDETHSRRGQWTVRRRPQICSRLLKLLRPPTRAATGATLLTPGPKAPRVGPPKSTGRRAACRHLRSPASPLSSLRSHPAVQQPLAPAGERREACGAVFWPLPPCPRRSEPPHAAAGTVQEQDPRGARC